MSQWLLLIGLLILIPIVESKINAILNYTRASYHLYFSGLLLSFFLIATGGCLSYIAGNTNYSPVPVVIWMTVIVGYIMHGIIYIFRLTKATFNKKHFVNLKAEQYSFYEEKWNACRSSESRSHFISQLTPDELIAILGDYFLSTKQYRLISPSFIVQQDIIRGVGECSKSPKIKIELVILPSKYNGPAPLLNKHHFNNLIIIKTTGAPLPASPDNNSIHYITQVELESILTKHFQSQNKIL